MAFDDELLGAVAAEIVDRAGQPGVKAQPAGLFGDGPFNLGVPEQLAAVVEFLALGQPLFLARRLVDQPVLPFGGGLAVGAQRRVERGVAAEAAVHRHHIILGDTQVVAICLI